MSTIRVLIATDNDAFASDRAQEVARILRDAAARIENGGDLSAGIALRDINGNTVGRAQEVDA